LAVATGWVAEAWQAVTLLCLAFFINDLAIPVIWAACTDIGGRFAGTVAGIMNMAGGIGSISSPMLTPVLLGYFDWPVVFAILACGWFTAAAAWLFIDASKPLEPEPESADARKRMDEEWNQANVPPRSPQGPADEHIQKD